MELAMGAAVSGKSRNSFFANICGKVLEDFEEGGRFHGQGVEARLEEREGGLELRIKDGKPEYGGVAVFPSSFGKTGGIQVLVSYGVPVYAATLYEDDVKEYAALEVVRLACVARFKLKDSRQWI